MQVQVNTSNGVENKETLERWAGDYLKDALSPVPPAPHNAPVSNANPTPCRVVRLHAHGPAVPTLLQSLQPVRSLAMNRHTVRLAALLALVLAALAAPWQAVAAPIPELAAAKVREVVIAQLSALAVDDADRAFETATPAVREAIGSPGQFLAMVRGAYPMVYRPASVSFHKPEEDDGSVLQLVEIKDERAKSWLALFALEEQPDHSWRISGCVVSENHWREI
ncbi:MAG: hypothetical protein NVS2B4_09350 [Ramlibacter sp.]